MLATLVLTAALHAATVSSPEEQLADAMAALDALEMERAAQLLEPLVATPNLDDGLRARAWLALGLTRASLLDTPGARAAFTAALAIDAGLELPDGTSPKVRAMFEKTRADLGIEVVRDATPAPLEPDGLEPDGTNEPTPDPPAAGDVAQSPRAPEPEEGAFGVGRMPWLVAGGVLLAGGALAGVAALVADDNLGRPTPERSRADYEGVRGLGIAATGTALALGATGALVVAAALTLVEDAP